MTTDQLEAAAKMAGQWWAERLAEEYAEQRQAFAKAVERCVLQELRGECYWDWHGERHNGRGRGHGGVRITNDYDPHNCLIPALDEVFPGMPPWKASEALPRKHELTVYADRLEPKEGYGNWTAHIPVLAATATNGRPVER